MVTGSAGVKMKKKTAAKTRKKSAKNAAKKPVSKSKPLITKDMTFTEVMQKCPDAGYVMMEYGLHCIGCHVAAYETVEQGGKAHGLNEKQLKKMIDEINNAAAKKKG